MAPLRHVVHGHLTLVVLGCLLLTARAAEAQDVTEPSLRANFVLGFAKFTTWPEDVLPPKGPLKACVLADQAFTDVLDRYAKRTAPIDGHSVVVTRVAATDAALRTCHLLYIPGATPKQAYNVVTSLAGSAVLTLSDVERFAQFGGIAQFYIEGGKTHFRINKETTKRARLQFSSSLLILADFVRDDPDAIPR